MENLLNIIYVIILFYLALKNPTKFVIAYFIYISSYFGLMSRDIIIGDVEYGQLFLNLIPLFFVLKKWMYISPEIKKIILFMSVFYLYGLIKPIFDGNQALIESIKSSKSMTFYFFVFYVLAFNSKLDEDRIFKFVKLIALYYSILYIVNALGLNIRPAAYIKYNFIQCHYDSFIYLGICIILMQGKLMSVKKILMLLVLYFGVYIGGYFSLFVMSVITLLGVFIFNKMKTLNSSLLLITSLVPLLLLFYYLLLMEQDLMVLFNSQIDAIDSRVYHNEFRWFLIEKQFWFGYGFISRGASVVSLNSYENSAYMRDLSFIDAGYIDLMGRYGLIGTILFLMIPLFFIFKSSYNKQTIPFIILIISFFAINITWSVFTYSPGIIVLSLVYSYLFKCMRNRKHLNIVNSNCGINERF